MKTIYYNGIVYTGSLPMCEAFAVEDGTFVFAGTNEKAQAIFQDGDRSIDLNGAFVCSGFNDSHMHLLGFGNTLNTAQLGKHTQSLQEMLQSLRNFAHEHSDHSGWLLGRGWNQDYFSDVQRMPDRYDLDQVSQTLPVCAVRACGHCLVVNSKALELLQITADSPQPEGGQIGMEQGKPDGRFYDNAMDLVYDAIPIPDKNAVKNMIRSACRVLNSYGITSCQTDDYCLFRKLPWQTIKEAYQELEQSGELTVRIYEQGNFTDTESLLDYIEKGNLTGTGSDFFQTGPLKMLGDGALGARTAFLSRPYADDPSTCGFPVFSQDVMDDMISCANKHNMQIAVHAIGDACLDRVLSAYEKALKKDPRKDHRHGIVHCQITRPDQLEKIQKLNLHVYAQSIFLDYDTQIVQQRTGSLLASTSYNWKTLMNLGVSVSNGSDCPVELPNVLSGIQCAVTRASLDGQTAPYLPDQAFSVQEALDSYTIRGAEASFEERKKGMICPGMLADFVILDQNPFTAEKEAIHAIHVLETYVGGKQVYPIS